MPDNGFGNKANSLDFLIRAYYIQPDFKTAAAARGGRRRATSSSSVTRQHIGFPIVNEGSSERLLTGADIDPESMQRAPDGDLWVGDEFGPWILHFSAPASCSTSRPRARRDRRRRTPAPSGPSRPPIANSRGFEGMAITPERALPVPRPRGRRRPVRDPTGGSTSSTSAASASPTHVELPDRDPWRRTWSPTWQCSTTTGS